MKSLKHLALITLVTLGGLNASQAWFFAGHVACDSNTNGILDATDTPIPGVLIVVTNTSGTYSNADWSTSGDGAFVLGLPAIADNYVAYIHPLTLPANSTVISPPTGFVTFSFATNTAIVIRDFLLASPDCIAIVPPPPPGNGTNACWLTGGGTIRQGKGKPQFSFGGNIFPGCSATAGDGGNWNVIAHNLRLHFQGKVVETVSCGNVPGIPEGSTSPVTPFNYIEFQGYGTLKGVSGSKANYPLVYFYGRAEDRSEPGKMSDRLYLRVYDAQDNTLLLISSDTANPLDIAPVIISTGNLQIHSSSCDSPPR